MENSSRCNSSLAGSKAVEFCKYYTGWGKTGTGFPGIFKKKEIFGEEIGMRKRKPLMDSKYIGSLWANEKKEALTPPFRPLTKPANATIPAKY